MLYRALTERGAKGRTSLSLGEQHQMKIKMVKRKWNTPRSWRGMKKLAMYCASHYPKDAKLAAAVRGCFTSFDECATTLSKTTRKHATKSRRKMARRAPKRWGARRTRRSAAKRWGTRRTWRRGGHRRTHRARRAG